MANPVYLLNANSPVQQVDTLYDAAGVAYYKLAGPGAKTYSGFGNLLAPHGVSSHADGSGLLPGDGYVVAGLVRQPTTTLSAAITSTIATSITVASAAGFPTTGSYRITIDTEDMLVTAGQGTTTWTVTRAYNGTTAATHLNAATVTGYVVTWGLVDASGRQIVVGAAAAGSAIAGNPVLQGGSDGANARALLVDSSGRLLISGAAASGSAVAGNPVLTAGSDGTNARPLATDVAGHLQVNSPLNVTVIASAAFTTTQTQADQTNVMARGIVAFLNVTSAGTGSITLEIDGKDPVSGTYYALLTGVAVTANGFTAYRVYPGLTAVANATASDVLPATWRIKVTANNANSITYSVGASLVP